MKIPVILDTDIGSDVDDLLALAFIMNSPEFELLGVTCVYGDVLLRAQMAMKALRLRDLHRIPVMMGECKPLLRLKPVWWAGHEGMGFLTPEDKSLKPAEEKAADFIVRTVMENPGEVHLITIGPLTNAALAFMQEPRLPDKLRHLTIMGGAQRGPEGLHLPYYEHNIRCDPEAAHIVISSTAPKTLIPIDVTSKVLIRREDVESLRRLDTEFHRAIVEQIERYPTYRKHGFTYLNDPLAVATVIKPELVSVVSLRVEVELTGQYTTGATMMRVPAEDAPPSARVALHVDAESFERCFMDTLAR